MADRSRAPMHKMIKNRYDTILERKSYQFNPHRKLECGLQGCLYCVTKPKNKTLFDQCLFKAETTIILFMNLTEKYCYNLESIKSS